VQTSLLQHGSFNMIEFCSNLRLRTKDQTTLQVRQNQSVDSIPRDSEPGESPGGEGKDDRKSLLECFKVSAGKSNQFKKPRRHKALT
jgi:hypothetical protein